MTFLIFHPEDGSMNLNCRKDINFKCVGAVEADSLSRAFKAAQNGLPGSEDWEVLNNRSTCVGDIIRGRSAVMVRTDGFEDVSDDVILRQTEMVE